MPTLPCSKDLGRRSDCEPRSLAGSRGRLYMGGMMAKDTSEIAVSPTDIVARMPDMVAASIDEVTALMSVEVSRYFILDKGGTVIWDRILKPILVADLCAALVQDYEVTPEACERDVLEFLNEMLKRRLIQIQAGAGV